MKSQPALIALLGCSLFIHAAAAQPTEEPRRDRARTFLVVRIADALKLKDQDALKVSGVIRQSDDRRRALMAQRADLEERLRAALAKQPVDNPTLTALIAEANELDQKLALLPEDTFRDLQKVLNVEQQANLMLFRRELQGEIRRAMQRREGSGRRHGQGRKSGVED